MSPLRTVLLAAAMALPVPAAFAQEQAPMVEKPASLQQNNSKGTAPGGAGSTGWTGGTGGSFVGTDHNTADPNWQPEMATGADLKGPPTRFEAGKTPE